MGQKPPQIILYGAGTQNLRMVYQPLSSAGYNVTFICDKDEKKQGEFFYGVEIVSLETLYEFDRIEEGGYEIIITVRTPKLIQQIRESLSTLKNATIYTFDGFIVAKKINNYIKRFSCIMVHLVDHCNMSCVRCSHFSPLAEKDSFYLDVQEFERDCKRLWDLTGGDIDEIQLSGGEPLLHSEIHLFPYIVRKYFKKVQIIIITNAIKMKDMTTEFYCSCIENEVMIWISRYPINLPYDDIKRSLTEKGISVTFGNTGNSKEHPKEMWGLPLKLEGNLNAKGNFDSCLCMQYLLRHGRMYPCANSAYIDLFNNYFKKALPGPKVNSVDIYEVKDMKELCERLSKPVPLCEYCDAQNRMEGIPWCISKKNIGEWIIL